MKAMSLTQSISADSVDILQDSFNSKVKNVIDDIALIKRSARRLGDKNHPGENQQQFRVWKDNAEKLSGCGGRRNLKFTEASIKTAFLLSMWNWPQIDRPSSHPLYTVTLNNTRTLFATVEKLIRGSGRYPLKPSIFASLLETTEYSEYTAQLAKMAARSSREWYFRLK